MDTKEINAAVKCAVETTQQPPSFFIHGSSVFALETEAVKTAETLKRHSGGLLQRVQRCCDN